jgi:hypothetical protein
LVHFGPGDRNIVLIVVDGLILGRRAPDTVAGVELRGIVSWTTVP